MKRFSLKNAFACFRAISLATAAAIGLTACGGGGGGGDEDVIAPESMDGVTVNFFGAFNMVCSRLSGTAGNEQGAAVYNRAAASFFLGERIGSGTGGRNVQLAPYVRALKYTYTRTGRDSGRVVFSWNPAFNGPWTSGLSNSNLRPPVIDWAYMFYSSGQSAEESQLTVDILFKASGRSLIENTARVRSAFFYNYATAPGNIFIGESLTSGVVPFDTADVQNTPNRVLTLTRGMAYLAAGYNPYTNIDDKTPASVVWTTLDARSVDLDLNSPNEKHFAFESANISTPVIPGDYTISDRGRVMVDSLGETLNGIPITGQVGSYTYSRIGGAVVKLAITYQKDVGGVPTTVTLQYTWTFQSANDGIYSESVEGTSGTFLEDLYGPNP
ncbi:MAG: hypothetical protein QM627_02070 [Luteolibacter sp.]